MKYCIPTIRVSNLAFELITCDAPSRDSAHEVVTAALADTHVISSVSRVVLPEVVADWADEAEHDTTDFCAFHVGPPSN